MKLTTGPYKHEDEFEITPTVEKRLGGLFIFGYDYTDTFSNEFFGSHRKTENFNGLVLPEYRDITYGLHFFNHMTRTLHIVFELSRNEREGNKPQTDYIERRGLLKLTYYVGPHSRR